MGSVFRSCGFVVLFLACLTMFCLFVARNDSVKVAGYITSVTQNVPKHSQLQTLSSTFEPTKESELLKSEENESAGRTLHTNLIILTYMRSGSSLTGNMFEYHPDVFYVFEPMHELKWLWWSTAVLVHYLNDPHRSIGSESDYVKQAAHTVSSIFNCAFHKIDIATLSQNHFYRSNSTKDYFRCTRRTPGVSTLPKCIPILNNKCRRAKFRVIKTIQFPMATAKALMHSDQSLKTIHLIRDPRATIASQVEIGRRTWQNVRSYSREHCNTVLKDIMVTERLLKTVPSSVKLVLYEDLCEHPIKTVKSLYDFAGLEFTDQSLQTVRSFTAAQSGKNCPYCTVRSNSTADSMLWRTKIPMKHVETIDNNCKEVYDKVGYIPAKSEEILRDLSHPLHRQINL